MKHRRRLNSKSLWVVFKLPPFISKVSAHHPEKAMVSGSHIEAWIQRPALCPEGNAIPAQQLLRAPMKIEINLPTARHSPLKTKMKHSLLIPSVKSTVCINFLQSRHVQPLSSGCLTKTMGMAINTLPQKRWRSFHNVFALNRTRILHQHLGYGSQGRITRMRTELSSSEGQHFH